MLITPVKQTKVYDLVIERIKQAILDGTFPPGSRLPSLKSLSESLGVGQAAVREAIIALRAIKLIEVRQGDGTFIAPLDINNLAQNISHLEIMASRDIQSLLELRISIETGAVRYAAERRQPYHLQEMKRIIDQMEQDIGKAELGEAADWDFHYVISKSSNNQYMQLIMNMISEKIKTSLITSRVALYQIHGEDQLLLHQHKMIYEAILHQRKDEAMTAMQQHLQHVSYQLNGGNIL